MSVIIGSIKIIASKLQEALSKTVPLPRKNAKRKKAFPITISYDHKNSVMSISEAFHERTAIDLDIPCEWPDSVQVDGVVLRKAVATYKPNDFLELHSLPDSVEIINGISKFKMPRLDGLNGSKIIKKPIPKNRRHQGKVVVKEEPFIGRVELDETWGFSARMPVPHHQYPDSRLPIQSSKIKKEDE